MAAWPHPLAHQRLGRLYEEMGKPQKAAAAYQRFIEAWKSADEPLQDRVEKTRQRLKALRAEKTAESNRPRQGEYLVRIAHNSRRVDLPPGIS